MSWNVWWRFGGNWREREARIVTRLRDLDVDVVGVQEVWAESGVTQVDVIAQALEMHASFAAPSLPPFPVPPETPEQREVELGIGLVSRWPIIATHRHALPCTHRSLAPIVLLATLDHPVAFCTCWWLLPSGSHNSPTTSRPSCGLLHVLVAATEWEPQFADDHLAQTQRLAELASDPALDGPLPVLLTADLNAAPDSVELQPLLEAFTDTWTARGGDPTACTLRSEHPFPPREATKQLDQRIDYVLARPGRLGDSLDIRRAFVVGDAVEGLHPSDHDAVVVDVAVPNAEMSPASAFAS